MDRRWMVASLVAAAVVASACGRLNQGPGTGRDEIPHPTGADDVVLRVDVGGGFVTVESTLAALPAVSIYGDGRMIVPGPTIEIYPSPALPNLQVSRLSEDAIQTVLRLARDAGLTDGDASYDYPCVADLPTTTFTVNADGRSSTVSAYALGSDQGDCPDVDARARAALVAFQEDLGSLSTLAPDGSVGPEGPYTPTEMRVYVLPYPARPDLAQQPVEWPLPDSLEDFGEPVQAPEGARCGVIRGPDLDAVLATAAGANQLTPWTSQGDDYQLIFRPLLPDEHGCSFTR